MALKLGAIHSSSFTQAPSPKCAIPCSCGSVTGDSVLCTSKAVGLRGTGASEGHLDFLVQAL